MGLCGPFKSTQPKASGPAVTKKGHSRHILEGASCFLPQHVVAYTPGRRIETLGSSTLTMKQFFLVWLL